MIYLLNEAAELLKQALALQAVFLPQLIKKDNGYSHIAGQF
jgi:hypothetical protein